MKRILIALTAVLFATALHAQETPPPAPGVVYGLFSDKGDAVNVNDLEKKIGTDKYEGKVKGKVVEVCQAMGCWAKLQREDGSTIMIKVLDHKFAMPMELIGKTIVAEGEAKIKETSVAQLKHYAEDAGKTKEEIEKIKSPKMEVLMSIKGVKVVE